MIKQFSDVEITLASSD